MKAAVQFVVRQSGAVAFLCLGFAFLQGCRVVAGLWQGSGLHGYVIEQGKAHMGQVVSVWASFLNMLAAIGLAVVFGLVALRHGGISRSQRAGAVESPGRGGVLRTKRKRARHQPRR